METVLYADVLLLIDFSMDVVAIWLTSCFVHAKITAGRVSAAAFLGAVTSTLLTVLSPDRLTVALSGIAVSYVMCKIVFCVRGVKAVKHTCALWLTGLLLGGVMSSLTAGNMPGSTRIPNTQTESGGIRLLPVAALLCAMLIFAVGRLTAKKSVTAELCIHGNKISLTALVDSGNLLCDPISGHPVVLITRSAAEMLLSQADAENVIQGRTEDLDESLRSRYRAVFAKGVTGEKLLPCIRPDTVTVDVRSCKAIVGISDCEEFAGGSSCIVPSTLV